jgi:PhnB protein
MEVQPYLFFEGRCEEALEFYKKALGATVSMMVRFKDSPDPANCGGAGPENIMHATFHIGESTLMASDGRCSGKQAHEGFALSLTPATVPDAERLFAALSDGGKIQMPLTKTFWSPMFGMCADRFGISWMISVMHK